MPYMMRALDTSRIPVRSKHSKLSAEALEDFAKEVKHYPVGWPDDGGEEYEGEVIEWFKQVGHKNGKPVAEFKSNRYIPQENGAQENQVGRTIRGVTTAPEDANAPDDIWNLAMYWYTDTANILSGA